MSKSPKSPQRSPGEQGEEAAPSQAIGTEVESVAILSVKGCELLKQMMPAAKLPADADYTERKLRLTVERAALDQNRGFATLAKGLTEGIDELVKAEIDDRRTNTNANVRDKDERREAAIEEKRARREGEERRKDGRLEQENARLEQEISERKTAQRDGSRERSLFMCLTALSFIATVVFAFLTAKYVQLWGYAGMGTGLLLSAGGLHRLGVLAPLYKARDAKGSKGKGKKG